MFKLVALLALVAVASARPGFLTALPVAYSAVPAVETRTSVIGQQTIESHGNSVVHSSAPVVTGYAAAVAPAVVAAPAAYHTAAIIPQQTIESSGHAVVHSAPVITSYAASAPLVYSNQYLY